MSRPKARVSKVDLPDFGMPEAMPELPPALYTARLGRLRERAEARGYDRLVIYADREHSANVAYLTGFDPRFEEAILIVGPSNDPALLVGNECYAMAGAARLKLRRHLFQDLSLPSQPRDRSRPLSEILAEEGIARGTRIGVVGWKTYPSRGMSDAPAFLVDELRRIAGASGAVENATDLLIDASDGLRVTSEVEQLAYFEWAACQTSQGVRNLVFGLRPGLTELEAVRLLEWNGTPLSCHLMLTAGPRARFGLLSPSDRKIRRSDPFTIAFGIWGALNCRAGFVAADAGELPVGIGDYVERLVAPYFEAVVEWSFISTSGSTRRSGLAPLSCSAPGCPCRSTSSRRPEPITSRRTSRTASRSPTSRCVARSPRNTRPPGSGSKSGAGSCRTSSESSYIRMCCRFRTSRRGFHRFSSSRGRR